MTGNVNPDAHRQLAITYNQLAIELYAARDYAKALTVYDMALEHDPKSSSTYVNRGDCHRDMQEVALALQDYLKAHDLDANDKEINIRISTLYDARGLTYFDRGLLFEAEKEFTLAIKYLPNVTHYYLHRATASYERGNQIQAVRDYKRVVELDPSDQQVWARLACFGDVSSFEHDAQKATKEKSQAGATRSTSSLAGKKEAGKFLTRKPERDKSPTRRSGQEHAYFSDLADKKSTAISGFRTQLAYKTGLRLDTSGVDNKYRDKKTGLPASGVKPLDNPYPTPSLR
mmetsp:Transcript_62875/g.150436  ORF Transcript_62875/g.150436 Transcript_62875/m.150436 type:complete len:287 (+) Transcript_62875:1-861(+)